MSRRLGTVLLSLVLMATAAAPALAHDVAYGQRETGGQECSFSQQVRTVIAAYGHHEHTKVGVSFVVFHTPTSEQSYTQVNWGVFSMQWANAAQIPYAYSYPSSGAVCVAG